MYAAESWFSMEDDATRVGAVRRAATALAAELGLAAHQVADLAIIATELSTNLVKHACEGMMHVRPVRDAEDAGVQLVSIDSGPGMADVKRSQVDGESTAGTLGIGLGAVARLADRCEVYSRPGRGTIVVAELWCRKPPDLQMWVDGITRPLTGEATRKGRRIEPWHRRRVAWVVRRASSCRTRSRRSLTEALGGSPLPAALRS